MVWVIHIGPPIDRYVDRTLPGGTLGVALYRMIQGCFHPITARNRSVTVDFDHRCRDRVASAWLRRETGRRSKEEERERGTHLQSENLETTSQMRRTSQGDDFFVTVFSSLPSPHLRHKEKRRPWRHR
ncbi:hypothetical protein B296_00053177 [Ensete ventricosum]|uniref:Uncharacterized protein n=1 Tax=Ensete ventricosum TaxID=4639 RepID=A0A426XVJ3_ENSVE|nr:hypothetical protein B296_00053177 [Ensete ventricosum]